MAELFLHILNQSFLAGWVVLAILLTRPFLKKAPKWIRVLLWGLVALRLLCPSLPESSLSLIPSAQVISPDIMLDPTPTIHTGIAALNLSVNPVLSQSMAPAPGASMNPLQLWIPVLSLIWAAGVVAMLAAALISWLRLRFRVRTAVLMKDCIFQCEAVGSPFVMGILKPRIYLPFHMEAAALDHVIAHEQAHIRRKDHWWKPLGYGLLTLHWFNPLLWLAYILLCRDIELACDEKVISGLDREARADYSQTLLDLSTNRALITLCPLAFGEVGTGERVSSVLHYKKPAFWILLASLVLCIGIAVFFLTDPTAKGPYAPLQALEAEDILQVTATVSADDPLRYQLTDEETAQLLSLLHRLDKGQFYRGSVAGQLCIHLRTEQLELLLYSDGSTVAFDSAAAEGTFWSVKDSALTAWLEQLRCKTVNANAVYAAGELIAHGVVSYLPENGSYFRQISVSNGLHMVLSTGEEKHYSQPQVETLAREQLLARLEEEGLFSVAAEQFAQGEVLDQLVPQGEVEIYSFRSDNSQKWPDYIVYWFDGVPQWFSEGANLRLYQLYPAASLYLPNYISLSPGDQPSIYQIITYLQGVDFSGVSSQVTEALQAEWDIYDAMTEEQRMASSHLFGLTSLKMDTWDQLEQALGFSVPNPLEDASFLTGANHFGMVGTEVPEHIFLMLNNTSRSGISDAHIETGYQLGQIRIQLSMTVKTGTGEYITFSDLGSGGYTEKTLQSESGLRVLVVSPIQNNSYTSLNAYWTEDHVLYSLHLVSQSASRRALEDALSRLLPLI